MLGWAHLQSQLEHFEQMLLNPLCALATKSLTVASVCLKESH